MAIMPDLKVLINLTENAYKDYMYMQYRYGVYQDEKIYTIEAFRAYQSKEKNHKHDLKVLMDLLESAYTKNMYMQYGLIEVKRRLYNLQFMKNGSNAVKTISKVAQYSQIKNDLIKKNLWNDVKKPLSLKTLPPKLETFINDRIDNSNCLIPDDVDQELFIKTGQLIDSILGIIDIHFKKDLKEKLINLIQYLYMFGIVIEENLKIIKKLFTKNLDKDSEENHQNDDVDDEENHQDNNVSDEENCQEDDVDNESISILNLLTFISIYS
ncbi:hypothetical protein C2G38_2243048 [Gigaspora rosea]|uniref:Uncharacterized protein n=1 Tax=Gigaspora rosea TaxID=44941 RepID=A0A397VLF9_9GLOM|nr:hypothetical protein C2G38_2243048 [Gigaspora rosea]